MGINGFPARLEISRGLESHIEARGYIISGKYFNKLITPQHDYAPFKKA